MKYQTIRSVKCVVPERVGVVPNTFNLDNFVGVVPNEVIARQKLVSE